MPNTFQNRFEMQGHESAKTFGLNRINFGARTYNPTIGRFTSVDPLAELDYSFSPFTYVCNNPLSFIDRFGLHPDPTTEYATGAIVENNAGAWKYLGEGSWETLWETPSTGSEISYAGLYPFFNGHAGNGSTLSRENGSRNAPFSSLSYFDGVNQRGGLVAAAGALVKAILTCTVIRASLPKSIGVK